MEAVEYFDCSTKTGDGVDRAMEKAVSHVLRREIAQKKGGKGSASSSEAHSLAWAPSTSNRRFREGLYIPSGTSGNLQNLDYVWPLRYLWSIYVHDDGLEKQYPITVPVYPTHNS